MIFETVHLNLDLASIFAHYHNDNSIVFCRLATSGDARGVNACLRKFVTAPPLYVCQTKFNVKNEVEAYLDKTFYDLCTLNLNDCNTYNQMRTIANEKYGLNLTDPFLPDGSLDQSIDFIDTLRDLDCK